MDIILLIGCNIIGVIIGVILITIRNHKKKIYGVIDVDAKSGLCRVHIYGNDLTNSNIKYVMFNVNHDINISDSRDEPPL